jgi:hypothetical protein
MLIFLFFILVTIKAVSLSIDYWKDVDDELAEEKRQAAVRASLSRTVRTGVPSSVRITPIKRADVPAKVTATNNRQYHLKDKGAA